MKCKYCNQENDLGSTFCFNCGQRLEQNENIVNNMDSKITFYEKKEFTNSNKEEVEEISMNDNNQINSNNISNNLQNMQNSVTNSGIDNNEFKSIPNSLGNNAINFNDMNNNLQNMQNSVTNSGIDNNGFQNISNNPGNNAVNFNDMNNNLQNMQNSVTNSGIDNNRFQSIPNNAGNNTINFNGMNNNLQNMQNDQVSNVGFTNQNINTLIDENNSSPVKKEGFNKIIFILIPIILVLLIIGVVVFLNLNSSPKKIFASVTNKFSSEFNNSFSNKYDSYNFNFEMSPIIESSDNNQINDLINNFTFKINGGIDNKNKKLLVGFESSYKKNSIFNFETMVLDDEQYVVLKGLYDKPIRIEDAETKDLFKSNYNNDYKIVVQKYVQAFNGALEDKYFDSSKETITINGKSVDAKVSTLNLTFENQKEISKKIINTLVKDKDFIKAYSNITNEDEQSVKEELEDSLEMFDYSSYQSDSSDIKISIYTEGLFNKPVKIKISNDTVSIDLEQKGKEEFLLSMKNNDQKVSFLLKYSYEINKGVKTSDVSNAVSGDEISQYELEEIIQNFVSQEGFVMLSNDFKSITGYSFEEMVELYMNGLNSYDNQISEY